MKRRAFLDSSVKASAGVMLASGIIPGLAGCGSAKKNAASPLYSGTPGFTQKPLPYDFKALMPAIDALTMEIHYTKHAAAYTKNMAEALKAEAPEAKSLEEVFAHMSKYSAKLRNNAGGHYNHESFWQWMAPGGKPMSASLKQAFENAFGSVGDLRSKFADAGAKRFGSGWAWLLVDANKKLVVGSTANQDNPLMDISELKGFPILGLDVWEHAYYLKYQNKRADYIQAWWDVINWQEVEAHYHFAMK